MLRVLHLADIHLGGGLNHGRINPLTGRNTRLEDFVKALSRTMDHALHEPVDLVLFGGDAFPTATPEPTVQEEFARQFMRLAQAKIPVIFLVGNHDLYNRGEGGASLNIYSTLQVPGFTVGGDFTTHRITTPGGIVQVVTLPWLRRSAFLTRDETRGKTLDEVDKLMLEKARTVLESHIRRLDPALPAILLAHCMVETASFGVERSLAIGRGFTLPLDFLARPEFAYVALGHVHRHQILCTEPPVVYPGSIERVDFSEEREEKGFMRVDIVGNRAENVTFVPLPARPFRTIKVDCTQLPDPQKLILAAIHKVDIKEAVVRLLYKVQAHQQNTFDLAPIYQALAGAFSAQLVPEVVSQLSQPRLPSLGEQSALDPMTALGQYLDHREDLKELQADLLLAARRLMEEDLIPEVLEPSVLTTPGQLRLL